MEFAIPTEVETLTGFTALDDDALEAFRNEKGLANTTPTSSSARTTSSPSTAIPPSPRSA